jgi:hypothetical protein
VTVKSLVIISVLAIAAAGIAAARSYSVTLTAPTKVGATELKPGEYEVSVKGSQAIFTSDSGKSFSVPVTVGQSEKKFSDTMVDSSSKDGHDNIKEIDLGGSTMKLQFGQ